MDVNVCVERSVIRKAYETAAERTDHQSAVAEVARIHLLSVETVQQVVEEEAA